jgi:hypothetical protein
VNFIGHPSKTVNITGNTEEEEVSIYKDSSSSRGCEYVEYPLKHTLLKKESRGKP